MALNFNLGTDYSKDFLNNYYSNSGSKASSNAGNLGSLSGSIGDYNSIKNGSYRKLVDSIYSHKDSALKVKESEQNSTSQNYKSVQASATSLKNSLRELSKLSLYDTKVKEIKDEKTGNVRISEEPQWDSIYTAIAGFADSYNKTLENFDNTNNNTLLKKGVYMTKFTDANKNLLSQVGITIGEGNKLSVDKDKLMQAGTSTLKSLFTGNNSYGQRMAERAGQIEGMTKNAVNKISKLYDGSGRYMKSLNTDSIINNYF